VADRTLNIDSHLAKIKNIENIVRKECSEKEGAAILGIATVARHSMQYWHDNYLKWITKLESTVVRPLKMNKLKSTEDSGTPLPDGYYAWAYDPHMYISIMNGRAYLMYCPSGMVFDDNLKQCVWEEDASFDWRAIVGMDVEGAVIGASTSGVNTIFGPVGWGAVGIATLGGAVGGSVGNAVYQIWRRYVN
jgi:hypothetical protein